MIRAYTDVLEGRGSISTDILARYAADAACEVEGVTGVVGRHLPARHGVRVVQGDGRATVELHLAVAWGSSIPDVARAVQRRVRDYLARMADLDEVSVDVVVAGLARPEAG